MALIVKGFTGSVGQVDFGKLDGGGIAEGVTGSAPGSSSLRVDRVVGQDRRVSIQTGSAKAPGARATLDATATYDLPANAAGQPRLDWLVLRFDWGTDPGTCVIVHVQGTAASNPQAPTLTRNAGVRWEIPLALIRVDSGVGSFPADAVKDARFWLGHGTVVQNARGVDPSPDAGRLLYIVNDAQLLAANSSEYGPVGPQVGAGNLGLTAGWVAYGGGFGTPSYRVSDGVVNLSGLIKKQSGNFTLAGTQVQIATVPVGARPVLRRVLVAMADGGPLRLDIWSTGVLAISNELAARTFVAGGYVALDGLTYRI